MSRIKFDSKKETWNNLQVGDLMYWRGNNGNFTISILCQKNEIAKSYKEFIIVSNCHFGKQKIYEFDFASDSIEKMANK